MYFLPLILDALCVVHVIKTGRDRIWIYAIIMLPMIGALLYGCVEIIPSYLQGYHGQKITSKALKTIDPHKDLRKAALAVELSDTVQNRVALAEANMALGRYNEAADLYARSASGIHADDTVLLMGLARASFASKAYNDALAALDRLRAANPDFQSHDGHLIYAASLEGVGQEDKALEEYEALLPYYPGEEARCRYGQLLDKKGRLDEARVCFEEVIQRSRHANRWYRRTQARWIDLARQKTGQD